MDTNALEEELQLLSAMFPQELNVSKEHGPVVVKAEIFRKTLAVERPDVSFVLVLSLPEKVVTTSTIMSC